MNYLNEGNNNNEAECFLNKWHLLLNRDADPAEENAWSQGYQGSTRNSNPK